MAMSYVVVVGWWGGGVVVGLLVVVGPLSADRFVYFCECNVSPARNKWAPKLDFCRRR